MAKKWYDKSATQTALLLGTDVIMGLSRDEVRARRRMDGDNDIYPTQKKNYKTYLFHLLSDYNSLLMLITLLIAAIFEESQNLLIMLAVLITYYLITVIVYVKSNSVLDDMGKGALPNAKVLREGRMYMVKQRQLVRGDIVYVSAGDIVPCDGRLVESNDLEVLEVNVTGVSRAVRKSSRFEEYHDVAPSEQKNMLFASSIVTKGTAKFICCECGSDTLVSIMKKNQPIVSHEKLHIFEKISVFCRRWTLFMTFTVLVLTVMSVLLGQAENGIFSSFMIGVSLAVSSMSEFYTAFAYVVLACGIFSALNRKNELNRGALIKNSAKLEVLKDLTCLIVPKEGAFNIRGMALEKVYANGDVHTVGERGYKRNAARVLRYALISTGKYGVSKLTQNNYLGENIYTPEEDAIINASESLSEYNIGLEKKYPLCDHRNKGADSAFDISLVNYENSQFITLRGDYSSVIPLCDYYTEDSRVYNMTEEKRNYIIIEAEKLARQSYKIIAVASKDVKCTSLKNEADPYSALTLEGFLAIKEEVMPEAAKNVQRCKNAGIKIIMLTEDESENGVVLAESLGIASNSESVVSGRALSSMKEGLIRINLDKYTVYQGLNLTQKRLIVRFLQESGEKVGYLCSELDEIILMKEADVGFAQSITISDRAGGSGVDLSRHNIPIYSKKQGSHQRGCEALKFVSDVIVSEPDTTGAGGFNAVIDSILCSKSVYCNLHRMLKYMISSQIARLALVFASIIFGFAPLNPVQILILGLMLDFAAIIIIAFEKPDHSMLKTSGTVASKLEKPFTQNPESALFGFILAVVTSVMAVYLPKYSLLNAESVTTFSFISYFFAQIIFLNECKREQSIFDKNARINGAHIMLIVIASAYLALSLLLPVFGNLFGIMQLSSIELLFTLLPGALICLIYEIFKMIKNGKRIKK